MKKIFTLIAAAVMSLGAFAQEDMSSYIKNNDFTGCSKGNFPDWTISAPNGGNTWNNGEHNVEYWIGTAANGSFDYYQEITELPNGKYTVSAKMWNSSNDVADAAPNGNAGVYASNVMGQIFAGVTVDSDPGSMQTYTTTESIIVADGKLRVGVKNNGTMTARWFGVDIINLYKVGELTEEDEAAYEAAVEAAEKHAEEYPEVPATAIANWTTSNGHNLALLAPNWANATGYTYVEAYNGGSHPADFTMSTQLTLKPNTNYLITVVGAASYTSGRGFECPTGTATDELAGLFASTTEGEKVAYIPVVERSTLPKGANDEATFLVTTGEDGIVTAGLKNFQTAGNWYACSVKEIHKVEVSEYSYNVTADITVGENSKTLNQTVDFALIETTKTAEVVLPAAKVNGWKMEETLVSGISFVDDENAIVTCTFPAATIKFTKNGETVIATVDPEKSSATFSEDGLTAEIYATSSKGDITVVYTEKPLTLYATPCTGYEVYCGNAIFEEYQNKIVIKSWDGAEGNDLVIKWEDGAYTTINGKANPWAYYKSEGFDYDCTYLYAKNGYTGGSWDETGGTFFVGGYFYKPGEQTSSHFSYLYWNLSTDDPTAVAAVAADAVVAPVKAIKNGKLVIVKDGKEYNAAGAQVK